jgi:poly(3-hydroxybutyrate) depolymerase
MLYAAYQAAADLLGPLAGLSRLTGGTDHPLARLATRAGLLRRIAATAELLGRAGLSHARPSFEVECVTLRGQEHAVAEETADATPFATLLRFRKVGAPPQPRVLLVAPLSGHFATLLRGTVQTLLPEHDVYITDWHNARNVPLAAGRFGLDDYIAHVIRFLEALGPGGHVLAVCQPCVQVLAAVAVMAEDGNPATPRSMTLMAGPVDTRINPTRVDRLATQHSMAWFRRMLITEVPPRFAGAGRAVYPGFLQLTAFLQMNLERHVGAHIRMGEHLARGEKAQAKAIADFYDEYFAVLDLPAEFYLETVERVFQNHELPRGTMTYGGRRIDPGAIRRTALLTVEGERDDICGVGQTLAAQELCASLKPALRRHHLQPGAGHYGVFSGRRWQAQIYPLVRNLILATD